MFSKATSSWREITQPILGNACAVAKLEVFEVFNRLIARFREARAEFYTCDWQAGFKSGRPKKEKGHLLRWPSPVPRKDLLLEFKVDGATEGSWPLIAVRDRSVEHCRALQISHTLSSAVD